MRRTEDVPIMEPEGREERVVEAGREGWKIIASRGSWRGGMAPMVQEGGRCVGTSAYIGQFVD